MKTKYALLVGGFLLLALIVALGIREMGPFDAKQQCELAKKYYNGDGVPKDFEKAFHWFSKSAKKGNAEAQVNLARMYHHGEGVPKDESQSYFWASKSADQGNPDGQDILGGLYFVGAGTTKDPQQAVNWFRKSAEQGFAGGQHDLAVAYLNGQGVPKDLRQAAIWFRKAAEQGDASAQYNLAVMYYNGEGTDKNVAEARTWLEKAADQNYQDAKQALNTILLDPKNLTDEELKQRVESGDEQAGREALRRQGITYQQSDAGGGWTKEVTLKNGSPTGLITFRAKDPKFSSRPYKLTVGCSDHGKGIMITLAAKTSNNKNYIGQAGEKVAIGTIYNVVNGGSLQYADTWVTADGTSDSLIEVQDPKGVARMIGHFSTFSVAVGKDFALFEVGGLKYEDFASECGL